MPKFGSLLEKIALTLWVGGLWAIGYIAAPVLFTQLADKQLAGNLAGSMFVVIAYVGMACGAYLLLYRINQYGSAVFKQGFFLGSTGDVVDYARDTFRHTAYYGRLERTSHA